MISRREFLVDAGKALAVALAAAHTLPWVPHKLLAEPVRSDAESKWCAWMMQNMDANQVIWSIKEYGFVIDKGQIRNFFNDFVKRQPEMVVWLKARIKLPPKAALDGVRAEYDPTFIGKTPESSHHYHMRWRVRSPGIAWYREAHRMHVLGMRKFGLIPWDHKSLSDESCEYRIQVMFEEHYDRERTVFV